MYVGNLSFKAQEDELKALFEQYGTVDSANIIVDRATNRSKGFGFVEMPEQEQAQAAMAELEGKDFLERPLRVSEARPKTDRPQRNSW